MAKLDRPSGISSVVPAIFTLVCSVGLIHFLFIEKIRPRFIFIAVLPLVLMEHLRLAPDFHKKAAKPIASRLKCQFFFCALKPREMVHRILAVQMTTKNRLQGNHLI